MLLTGAWSQAKPAIAQALLPYTLPLDQAQFKTDGENLARDAALQAQFQQYDEALARAQLAAQLLPGNPDVLLLLGSLYLQATEPQPDKAIETLNRAKDLKPDNSLVLFTLGNAYFSQQQYAEAAQSLESGLRIDAANPGALFDLGNTYYKLGKYDQAIAQYEKAVSSDPKFWAAINNIGLVKYESGDTEGAIAQWQKALDLAGTDGTEPQLAIAVAKFKQGAQAGNSSDVAIAALERDPRYAKIDFLKENLWGEKLVTATEAFFNTPMLKEILVQL